MQYSEGNDSSFEYSSVAMGTPEPNLNPIEHLWDYLGKAVNEMHPTALSDLKDKLFCSLGNVHPTETEKLLVNAYTCTRGHMVKGRGYQVLNSLVT